MIVKCKWQKQSQDKKLAENGVLEENGRSQKGKTDIGGQDRAAQLSLKGKRQI